MQPGIAASTMEHGAGSALAPAATAVTLGAPEEGGDAGAAVGEGGADDAAIAAVGAMEAVAGASPQVAAPPSRWASAAAPSCVVQVQPAPAPSVEEPPARVANCAGDTPPGEEVDHGVDQSTLEQMDVW